jgi:hypothetical protein
VVFGAGLNEFARTAKSVKKTVTNCYINPIGGDKILAQVSWERENDDATVW